MDTTNCRKILKKMGILDHLTCFLRNLYAGQEATVRTGHGTMDWFKIGNIHQGCILSPCLFNLYAEYIKKNTWLDESQAGIKISRRNINNLRYANDTTSMAESSAAQFSHSVMSDSLRPLGLKHARPPCPLPTPRVYSNSCPLSW